MKSPPDQGVGTSLPGWGGKQADGGTRTESQRLVSPAARPHHGPTVAQMVQKLPLVKKAAGHRGDVGRAGGRAAAQGESGQGHPLPLCPVQSSAHRSSSGPGQGQEEAEGEGGGFGVAGSWDAAMAESKWEGGTKEASASQ